MIEDNEFATPGIICEAKPGICQIDAKCSSCDFGKKYKLNKILFELFEEHKCRDSNNNCKIAFERCKGVLECDILLKIARSKL
jgi:hypothetical protein